MCITVCLNEVDIPIQVIAWRELPMEFPRVTCLFFAQSRHIAINLTAQSAPCGALTNRLFHSPLMVLLQSRYFCYAFLIVAITPEPHESTDSEPSSTADGFLFDIESVTHLVTKESETLVTPIN